MLWLSSFECFGRLDLSGFGYLDLSGLTCWSLVVWLAGFVWLDLPGLSG